MFHNRNERGGEKKKSSAELHNIVLVPVTLVMVLGGRRVIQIMQPLVSAESRQGPRHVFLIDDVRERNT